MKNASVNQVVDHLFRHEYGNLVAGLAARFGAAHIDWIEDAVQESLYKAMKIWPFEKMPEKPGGWLYRVAHHQLIDRLRQEKRHSDYALQNPDSQEEKFEMRDSRAIQDEQLQLIFACCHPSLSEKNSLLLSLKLMGGFSVKEIARAMLMKEEAAKKAVQRARGDFQSKVDKIQLPAGRELPHFLNRVLKVIYLIFNEGYKASDGDQLVKEDLCGEALRLSLLLSQKDYCQTPELFSLISLMCFKAARFDARLSENGELVLLENQDRADYDAEYIQWGYYYFNQATKFQQVSPLFWEAAIEYQYHSALGFAEINWEKVLWAHQKLQEMQPSVSGQLNLLIVFSKVKGAAAALSELQKLESQLPENHLFYAFQADLLEELGREKEAEVCLEKAVALVRNEVERRYLQKKLAT